MERSAPQVGTILLSFYQFSQIESMIENPILLIIPCTTTTTQLLLPDIFFKRVVWDITYKFMHLLRLYHKHEASLSE